jgi:hypothetical protein
MGIALRHFLASTVIAASFSGLATAQVTTPSGGTVSVPTSGTLSLGCNALVVQGGFDVGPGQVNNTGNVNINTGGVLNGSSGTLSVSGNWSNSGTFNAGTGSVVFTDGCAAGARTFTGNTVFNNLTLTSTTGRNFVIPSGTNITVNGTLTLQGTPGQPISLTSSAGQLAVINLGPSAQVIRNDVALGNVQIGAVTGVPTLSEYGLMLLAMLMAGSALWQQRQGTRRAARSGNTQ